MKRIIALDADGVLLDYHASYREAWARAFGVMPELSDPQAYWPIDRWAVRRLDGKELNQFRACFNEEFWATIPAISGAVEASHNLVKAGFQLICVSAIEDHFANARLTNLKICGFPIDHVIATPNTVNQISPKADALRILNPVAFVDDFAPYLMGLPQNIHAALITREPNGSPNVGENLKLANSRHKDLLEFSNWWISQAN